MLTAFADQGQRPEDSESGATGSGYEGATPEQHSYGGEEPQQGHPQPDKGYGQPGQVQPSYSQQAQPGYGQQSGGQPGYGQSGYGETPRPAAAARGIS